MRRGFKCAFVIGCAVVTAMCGDRGNPPPEASAVSTPAPTPTPTAAAEPIAPAQAKPGATLAPPHEASNEFQDKLKEYLALRAKVEAGLPKLTETKDPGKIAERSSLLAAGIQEARRTAVQGSIFTPKVAAEFRRILAADSASRTAKEKANIMDEVPAKAPQVNALYPVDSPTGPAALASFPAKLLGLLPELPETVEYRFLGQALVLRDASANIIVDYLTGVAPARSGGRQAMTPAMKSLGLVALAGAVASCVVAAQTTSLPCKSGSFRFGVIGDFGDGSKGEYATAAKFADEWSACSFDTVITVGDNIYGSERPQEFVKKFETPFKPLLDKGVKFYASLGNHDDPNQRFYKPFNMNEQRYYKLSKRSIDFFALDSNYMDKKQLEWLEGELKGSKADWKVPYFHHPLYSSAGAHGSSVDLRSVLEPLFVRYGVQVVFSGHDHSYERTTPQKGIYYFVAGSTGKLRKGDVTKSGFTATSYDQGRAVVVAEVTDDAFFFKTVSEQGKVVDSGCIPRAAELPASAASRTRCPAPAKSPVAGGNR